MKTTTKRKALLLVFTILIMNCLPAQISQIISGVKNSKAQKQKVADAKPDEGITGPIHQKYVEQMVLSNKKIERDVMNTSDNFKKKFILGERIYGRVFLEKGVNKYLKKTEVSYYENGSGEDGEANFATHIEIDGKKILNPINNLPIGTTTRINSKDENGKYVTTFQLWILPDPEDEAANVRIVDAFNKLSVGDHEIKLIVWSGSGRQNDYSSEEPILTTSFTLTVPAGAAQLKIGKSFASLEAGMKNAELENKIVKAAIKKAKTDGWKESFTKAIISSEAWFSVKNQYTSVVEARTIDAWVYATWPDEHCTYQLFSFNQDFDGIRFSDYVYLNGTGQQTKCDCDK